MKLQSGVSIKQLLPPAYPLPLYVDRDWYKDAKRTGRPIWSEPFDGKRANDTPMVTYSVPIQRNGQFIGVVTADLTIRYFRELHDRLKKQYMGAQTSSFVISPGGTFLYHRDPRVRVSGSQIRRSIASMRPPIS